MEYSLKDLRARFLRHKVVTADKGHGRQLPNGEIQWGGFDVDSFEEVKSLADADGISFLCPKCYGDKNSGVGVHRVHVHFVGRNTPDRLCMNGDGRAVKWDVVGGTCLGDLQLSPSILLLAGCEWHGWVGSSGITPGHAG